MAYEIDYIPVGTNSKGGDAIALRYGDFTNPMNQKVVVIDGGTKDSGKALVEHIKTYYGTTHVDTVVASHLHSDHISGLTEVFDGLSVGKLVVHYPWEYTEAIQKMSTSNASQHTLETRLEKSLSALSSLADLAEEKGVEVTQPFAGQTIMDGLYVLGPTKEYYESLLVNFGVVPEAKEEHKIQEVVGAIKDAINWVAERLDIETLSDDYPDTSSENNSSLVLLLVVDGKRFLFTGDAGKDALTRAIDYCEGLGISLSGIDFFDVPHHGSKRNLGPTILNRLTPKTAFISCPREGDPKHPSRKVCNALRRRGCPPLTTRNGATLCHPCDGAPERGWQVATPEPFFDQVEE